MLMTGSATARFDKIAPFIAIPLLLLSGAMQVRFAIMGDKGWLLLAAGEWLSGKKLYVDIFEVNPPLIIWLYAAAVWVSRHITFFTDYAAMGCMGLIATGTSILLSLRLISAHPAFAEEPGKRTEFMLLLAAIFIFLISPVYFFDREQIMLTLTFPYVVRFMPSLARMSYPLSMRLAIGLLAAIGFSIKPHAALVFVLLQLIYLVRERSPFILASIENIVIYLFGVTYLAIIVCTMPEYFTTVLPMAIAVYSSYSSPGSLHYHFPIIFITATIPLLDFRPRYVTPFRREIYYIILVTLIYFGYAVINNGWGYTYQPLYCMLTFLTAWLWWEYDWLKRQHVARSLPSKQFEVGLRGCLYCLAINGIYGLLALNAMLSSPDCGGYSGCIANKAFVDAIHDNGFRSFGVMSGEFTRWPEITRQSGARWDTRFNHLWMVPGLIKAQEQKATSDKWNSDQWIITYVGQAFADDFERRKPDAMFIDHSDEFFTYPQHPVDVLAMLEVVPEFKKAWSHYHYVSSINHCKSKVPESGQVVGCRYDIYRWKQ